MSDRRIIYAAAFLRALAVGWFAPVLGVHLARGGLEPEVIGAVVSAGLGGAALASLLVTVFGDQVGRRASLAWLAILSALGTFAVAWTREPLLIGVAAFVGMLNGMGRDRGPSLILEQAALPRTTNAAHRTSVLAWYNLFQDAGHALGSLGAGTAAFLTEAAGAGQTSGSISLTLCAILLSSGAILAGLLSPAVEKNMLGGKARSSPVTRRTLWRLSALFALDSLGGGFLTTSLLSYFFFERFGTELAALGGLFFVARVLNMLSHLAAAALARKLGLVRTMVFTHLPSSLLLVTVAFAPSFPIAALLFLLREGLVEMDVPTRQSYVLALVRPEEHTMASGVTHLVRLLGWGVSPVLAGWLMGGISLWVPLIVGASLKIAYDLTLYRAFRFEKPPEESRG